MNSNPKKNSSKAAAQLAPLLVALLLASLSGCASFQDKTHPTVSWPEHQAEISQLKAWVLRGKLGIKAPDSRHSASLHWQQDHAHYQIQLSGPLSQGKIRLSGTAEQLRLERSQLPTIETTQPETLLMQELGWLLPIKQIHFWVKGLPAPNIKIEQQLLTDGVLTQLQQGGWTLQYSRYQNSKQHLLPGKIVMSKGQIRLTLIAKQWQLMPTKPDQP